MASQVEPQQRSYSLRVHQPTQYETYGDLMVSQQGNQDIQIDDIVKVSTEKCTGPILLKVSNTGDSEMKKVDTVSILDTISTNRHFNFKMFDQVFVEKVDPKPVDLLVLTCKDTYLSRSDMWRLKKYLEGTCVYIDKRLNFLGLKMQISVSEIWCSGDVLTCGYISTNTKILFRSATAAIHLFLQMSAEMWQYDSYGDLYFEKAASGFLNDLFKYWQDAECCHDVTIVMFSRTFYEANSLDEFPEFMKEGLQRDVNGRFYEDFYRVVIQNERYDDWRATLMKMKKLFINYENKVLRNEERQKDPSIPKAYNSSASMGNFLEVLNLSLNVYEKYYLDRNFDRLGKTSMVITPGPGVFEVDKELMSVTKHRTIDSGCSADLICMGEQPLHAVPLFKFTKQKKEVMVQSDYKIPKSWLNHSFYTSQSQMRSTSTSQFIPRIKQASVKSEQELIDDSAHRIYVFPDIIETDESAEDSDYDSYDREIFKGYNKSRPRSCTQQGLKKPRGRAEALSTRIPRTRNLSDDDRTDILCTSVEQKKTASLTATAAGRYQESSIERDYRLPFSRETDDSSDDEQFMAGSADKLDKLDAQGSNLYQRKNIDPFAPNTMKQQMSANRRRWVDAFPLDRNGVEIQPHHFVDDQRLPVSSHKLVMSSSSRMKLTKRLSSDLKPLRFMSITSFECMFRSDSPDSLDDSYLTSPHSFKVGSAHESHASHIDITSDCNLLGRSGDAESSEFTPMVKTGVDWRSLITPALLPITTDYYPDEPHFDKYYKDQVYTLDPLFESPLTYAEFFKELVNIRLALGFQVIQPKTEQPKDTEVASTALTKAKPKPKTLNNVETFRLSIGKIFHQISLGENSITVRVQKPKNGIKPREIQYKYQFLNPDAHSYSVSFTKFATEQLENYSWNLLDNYVINRGFEVIDNYDIIQAEKMKYWRSRFCLLPGLPHVKTVYDHIRQKDINIECDEFTEIPSEQYVAYNENFIRFMELINSVPKHHRQRSGNKNDSKSTDDSRNSPLMSVAFERSIDIRKLVDTMKDSSNGLSFIDSKSSGLPSATFISYEAIQWLKNGYVNTTSDAISLLNRLLDERYIQHISGNSQFPFVCGFYLYYITSVQSSSPSILYELHNEQLWFKREWVEVALAVNQVSDSPISPRSLHRQKSHSHSYQRQLSRSEPLQQLVEVDLPESIIKGGYKSADIDTHLADIKVKNELRRIEWTSIKYSAVYHPNCAYDFELDWIVATAGLLYEMINSWRRKVNHYGYLLLPIPVDPFALPTEKNSDPLRGPIFISLAEDFHDNHHLVDFMSYVIKRFGFIPIDSSMDKNKDHTTTEYIHCSGGFFVLIQSHSTDHKPGFHWTWNFMMTKQWWTAGTDNELFQDTMLAEFRLLAANSENRLSKMWQQWNRQELE